MTPDVENQMMKQQIPNKREYYFGPMKNETRELWDTFYAPHNRRLAAILNDTSFLWKP